VVGLPAGYRLISLTSGTIDLRVALLPVTADVSRSIVVGLALDPTARPPFVRVTGRVTGEDASTYAKTQISLTSSVLAVRLSAAVAPDGTFSIPQVLPGTYRVRFIGIRPMTGDPAISLGVGAADLSNVELPMPAWREIAGRIVIPSGMAVPRFVSFTVQFPNGAALSADGSAADIERTLAPGQIVVTPLGLLSVSAQVQPDGTFTVRLPAGERQFRLNDSSVPPGSILKSVTFGAADLLKEPMRVTTPGVEELVLTFDIRTSPGGP
jgi:hypothetical protein